MILLYPSTDYLTGDALPAGTTVIGTKATGRWQFTRETIGYSEFAKLCEVIMISLGDDEGGPEGILDHEDYLLLAEYSDKYPRIERCIGVDITA